MYFWLRQCHLWLTFVSVVVLVSLSISGALLVFAKDIERAWHSDYWQVSPQAEPLPLQVLSQSVQEQVESPINTLYLEQEWNLAWQAQLATEEYVTFSPYSGMVLHRYRNDETLYGFLLALHRTLLVDEALKSQAKTLVSATTLIFCVNALLGLWLWLKPKHRWRRLQFRKTKGRKAQLYQLHSIAGVYLVLPLILIAFAGMTFYWVAPTRWVVETFTGQTVVQPQHPRATSAGPVDLTGIREQAQSVLPAGEIHRIYFPKQPGDTLRLRVQMPGETHPYSWVWIEPATGAIIQHFDASAQNFATQVWHFRYKFHIGEWWNGAIKALWLILALMPTLWAVTGLWMYLKGQMGQRSKRAAPAEVPQSVAQTPAADLQ